MANLYFYSILFGSIFLYFFIVQWFYYHRIVKIQKIELKQRLKEIATLRSDNIMLKTDIEDKQNVIEDFQKRLKEIELINNNDKIEFLEAEISRYKISISAYKMWNNRYRYKIDMLKNEIDMLNSKENK